MVALFVLEAEGAHACKGAPFSREHARLAARLFYMRGREEALASLQLSKARHVGQLCRRGRRPGNRAQGGLGAWPPGASRAGHCRRAGARGDWGAPVMQGDVQAQGRGCDARGRDDLGPVALVFRGKKVG